MKIKSILIALALACLSFSATAIENDGPPVIVVGGIGEVNVEPDEMLITLRIEKTDKDLQVAKRMNDESVEKIMSLTKRYSIPARDIETRRVSMEMVRAPATKREAEDDDVPRTGAVVGYTVAKSMIVKLSDINQFEPFYTELLRTGLSEVEGVIPSTSKLSELKSIARAQAMKAAREKASAMAGAIGQSIGKAIRISENSDPYRFSSNSSLSVGSYSEDTTLYAPGTISVRVSVTVSFELK